MKKLLSRIKGESALVLGMVVFTVIASVLRIICIIASPEDSTEVVKEVPVEVIREVPTEIIKEVEVVKEVPIEVVRYIRDESYDLIEISPEEYDLLARILALEAKNQPDIGQRAVVEVVLNRVLNGWGESVWNVLMAAGQFSTIMYLDCPYAVPEEREYANIDYVLEHGRTVLPEDYVYFATYKANGKNFIQIQDHYFGEEEP